MVLDPITAVSLAGSVVQIVDFVTKLVGKGNELHASTSGALVEHLELEAIALNLTGLVNQLAKSNTSTSALGRGGHALPPTKTESALGLIADACESEARDLLDAIGGLKVHGVPKKWNTFKVALKGIWKQDRINTLLERMTRCRDELSFHLMNVLNEKQTLLSRELRGIEDLTRQTSLNVLKGRRQIQQSILKNSQGMQDILYAIEKSEVTHAEQMSVLLTNMANHNQTTTLEQRLLTS